MLIIIGLEEIYMEPKCRNYLGGARSVSRGAGLHHDCVPRFTGGVFRIGRKSRSKDYGRAFLNRRAFPQCSHGYGKP